ncbi:MAG: VanZ family protein [Nitrospirales bacterium]
MNHYSSGNRVLWYWVPLVLYAGLIVFLSSLSTTVVRIPTWYEGIDDKIIHAIEYAILAVLFYRVYLYGAGSSATVYAPMLAIVSAILFGMTDEVHQYFVPHRHADGWDVFADAVGALFGVRLWQWLRSRATAFSSA